MYCSMFGHQFKVSKHITNAVKEYQCTHCGLEATTNGNGKLTKLTPKYKDINSTLEHIYSRRKARKNLILDH